MSKRDAIRSSSELLAFYRAWLEWAEQGAPADAMFDRSAGLCASLKVYSGNTRRLGEELMVQFYSAGLSTLYPFGELAFDRGRRWRSMHADPERVQWVRDRIADGVAEEP